MTARNDLISAIGREVLLRNEDICHPFRVAIDGRTASGKTTFSDELAAFLRDEKPVIQLSIDGFHRPRAERYRRSRLSPTGYLDDSRDWVAVRELILLPLGPGGDRRYRTQILDLEADIAIDQEPLIADLTSIALIEGAFLQRSELSKCFDLVIFLDVSAEISLARGTARDFALLGGHPNAREIYEKRYLPAFAMYEKRAAPQANADAVVDNNDITEPRLRWNKIPQGRQDTRDQAGVHGKPGQRRGTGARLLHLGSGFIHMIAMVCMQTAWMRGAEAPEMPIIFKSFVTKQPGRLLTSFWTPEPL